MTNYRNPITNQIFQILSPLIGDIFATGIIKSQAKKLGVTEETIKKEHLPILASEIKVGLTLFIGSDVASKVGEKVLNIH